MLQNLISSVPGQLKSQEITHQSPTQQQDQYLLLHVRTSSRKSCRKSGSLLGCEAESMLEQLYVSA